MDSKGLNKLSKNIFIYHVCEFLSIYEIIQIININKNYRNLIISKNKYFFYYFRLLQILKEERIKDINCLVKKNYRFVEDLMKKLRTLLNRTY